MVAPPRERTTRADWKRHPPPARTARIPVDITFTAEEFERLRYGLMPRDMDDKWFVYAAGRTVHFHRSWTGFWIFSLAFTCEADRCLAREATVNRDPSQYTADDAEDRRLIPQLVRMVIQENEGWQAWRAESAGVRRAPDLQALTREGAIRLRWSDALLRDPEPLPAEASFDRVEGMLLGLAIGDALGSPTEGRVPAMRPRVEGYAPNPWAGGRPAGTPTDDTQLAFWTLEQLIADGGLDPERLARRLTCQRIFGIGHTVREAVGNYKQHGDWRTCGVASAGNGALMRIAPVLVPHLRHPTARLWADAALAGMITHNDYASNAVCVAFVHVLWDALHMTSPPPPGWWLRRFVEIAGPLEGDNVLKPRFGDWLGRFQGPLTEFTDLVVTEALASGLDARTACDRWGSGAYLLETVPSALFILERHGASPRDAILSAVNDTMDNDTTAAIVGAAVGALHGRRALPQEWVAGLLGRTAEDDDGYVFDLIRWARGRFWDAAPAAHGPRER